MFERKNRRKKSDLFLNNQVEKVKTKDQKTKTKGKIKTDPEGILFPPTPKGAKRQGQGQGQRRKGGLTGGKPADGQLSPFSEGGVVPSRQGFALPGLRQPLTAFLSKTQNKRR